MTQKGPKKHSVTETAGTSWHMIQSGSIMHVKHCSFKIMYDNRGKPSGREKAGALKQYVFSTPTYESHLLYVRRKSYS